MRTRVFIALTLLPIPNLRNDRLGRLRRARGDVRLECSGEVGDQVFRRLYADGDANKVFRELASGTDLQDDGQQQRETGLDCSCNKVKIKQTVTCMIIVVHRTYYFRLRKICRATANSTFS